MHDFTLQHLLPQQRHQSPSSKSAPILVFTAICFVLLQNQISALLGVFSSVQALCLPCLLHYPGLQEVLVRPCSCSPASGWGCHLCGGCVGSVLDYAQGKEPMGMPRRLAWEFQCCRSFCCMSSIPVIWVHAHPILPSW